MKNNKLIKLLILSFALIIILTGTIGKSLAILIDSSDPIENEFVASKVSCEIIEQIDNDYKKSVKIKNTGDCPSYIRLAVIANTVNEDGNITGSADVESNLCGSGWVKSGMYYYYTQPVDQNGITAEFLNSDILLDGIQVTILAEAIQADPDSVVENVWGVSPSSLGGS